MTNKLQEIEQNQLIGYWIKSKGITFKDLQKHPQIDDVILLLKVKQMAHMFTNSEQSHWGAVWAIVYKDKKPLKQKHITKIQKNIEQAITRHNYKQKQLQANLKKIYKMRENQETHIPVYDNDDKGTGL